MTEQSSAELSMSADQEITVFQRTVKGEDIPPHLVRISLDGMKVTVVLDGHGSAPSALGGVRGKPGDEGVCEGAF